ncbi:MAG: L-rhamnose isomerase [Lentisphaeria bacterium]|nr:L-rhamnose isomerase [Lentisphaeria bacterium]
MLLHVSRGVRWDSDHIVLLDDSLLSIAREAVLARKHGAEIHLMLDYFDGSVNRVGAWAVGSRALAKGLLIALLEPTGEIAEAEQKLLNLAMKLEREKVLKASPYQRTEGRTGYANGFKERHIQTRMGDLELQIPQTRNIDFYPTCLEKGLRSERPIRAAMAEMYIQGVATRSVKNILEKMCGLEVSAMQVSRATKMLDEEFEEQQGF